MDPGGDASDAVFQSAPWFDLLAVYGFEQPVAAHDLRVGAGVGIATLWLMPLELGRYALSLSNYYSGLYGLAGDLAGLSLADWIQTVRTLRESHSPHGWHLRPLDAQAPWLHELMQALQASGYWTDRYFCFGNWYQPVAPGGFETYWAARPSALRNTVARARRRLDRQGNWALQIITDDAGLDVAIDAYVAVYNRSWKTPEPNPAFIPALIRLAAQQGWLRLGLVHVAGEPVAAQLWLVAGGKANIFKLAYVQGAEKLSVGSVLTAELMRHVMDVDQVHEVDFLSGDDPYKADWMDHRRERIGLVAFDKRHWRGWLAAARHELGTWSRSWRSGR